MVGNLALAPKLMSTENRKMGMWSDIRLNELSPPILSSSSPHRAYEVSRRVVSRVLELTRDILKGLIVDPETGARVRCKKGCSVSHLLGLSSLGGTFSSKLQYALRVNQGYQDNESPARARRPLLQPLKE